MSRPRLARREVVPGEPFPLGRRARAKLPYAHDLERGIAIAIVVALSVVGAALRFAYTRGLSLEEIQNVGLGQLPFSAFASHLSHAATRPPLFPVIQWCIVHVFGTGTLAVRLPSLIAGTLLIPLVGWVAEDLFGRRAAVAAAAFATVAPALVWYSQEATNYIFVALFGTLAVGAAFRAARHGRPADWVLHAIAASLTIWSGWSGVFVILATEIVLLVAAARRRGDTPFVRLWLLGTLALACQLVPLGLLFSDQLRYGGGLSGVAGVAASGVSFYTTVANVSWGLFGFQPGAVTTVLSAVWPLAMLASLVMVGRQFGLRAWLVFACALVPALAVLVLGAAVPGSFDVRYALAAIPPILVLIARAATDWPRGRSGRILVVGAILIVFAGALLDEQLNSNNPRRFDYGQAFAQVQRDAGHSAALLIEPRNLAPVVTREAPRLRAKTLTTTLPTRAQASSVFIVTSFSNNPRLLHLRNREIGALRATRRLVSHQRYPGVDVWWFR